MVAAGETLCGQKARFGRSLPCQNASVGAPHIPQDAGQAKTEPFDLQGTLFTGKRLGCTGLDPVTLDLLYGAVERSKTAEHKIHALTN